MRRFDLAIAALAAVTVAGCSSSSSSAPSGSTSSPAAAGGTSSPAASGSALPAGTITVFAASSLMMTVTESIDCWPLPAVMDFRSSSSTTTSAPASSPSSPAAGSSALPAGTITVFAAASLMGTFTELGKQCEAAHPGDTVKFSFGGSSTLATQITSGAPADVFASAAPKNMETVVSAGDASNPQDFAKNTAEIAVPPSGPAIARAFAADVPPPVAGQVLVGAGSPRP